MITAVIGGLFGYYAFGNPDDSNECYFADGQPHLTEQEGRENADVGMNFYIFFLMGFILVVL